MGRLRLVECVAWVALLGGVSGCAALGWKIGIQGRIASVAQEKHCTPFGDVPEKDIYPDPWWVSLEPLTGDGGDSAFLCKARSRSVTLVILDVRSQRNPWVGCPSVVGELTWWPAGLSILTPGDPAYPGGTLSAWRDRAGLPGPEDVEVSKPVLDTSQQIAGSLFYCHEGRWLALFVH
jgi:hypothetical protein